MRDITHIQQQLMEAAHALAYLSETLQPINDDQYLQGCSSLLTILSDRINVFADGISEQTDIHNEIIILVSSLSYIQLGLSDIQESDGCFDSLTHIIRYLDNT